MATTRIQAVVRGRIARKRASVLEQQKANRRQQKWRAAIKLQAAWRRRLASRELRRRREEIVQRERAAIMLQIAFRARKARDSLQLLALAKFHATRDKSARVIQRRWRTRCDRVGVYLFKEMKRRRLGEQTKAAIELQRAFRRYLIRSNARKVVQALREREQLGLDMESWAATLVQSHWRRRLAKRELARAQADKRSRWKQLVDTWNQHGMGYGAPFYYVRALARLRSWIGAVTHLVKPCASRTKSPEKSAAVCRANCLCRRRRRLAVNAVRIAIASTSWALRRARWSHLWVLVTF